MGFRIDLGVSTTLLALTNLLVKIVFPLIILVKVLGKPLPYKWLVLHQ